MPDQGSVAYYSFFYGFLRLYQLLTYFRPVFQYVTKFHSLDENKLAINGCLAGALS